MDTAILLSVVKVLQNDYVTFDIGGRLNALIEMLSEFERNSATVDNSKFEESTTNLLEALDDLKLNKPCLYQEVVLNEIKAFEWLGDELKEKIKSIIKNYANNRKLMIQVLLDLKAKFNMYLASLNSLISGFARVGIEEYVLLDNDAKIVVVFQEDISHFSLDALEKEFRELKKTLNFMSEIVGDQKKAFTVSSIGSTDFTLIIDSGFKTAAFFAATVTFCLKIYKDYLDILLKRKELKKMDFPVEVIEKIVSVSEEMKNKRKNDFVENIIAKYLDNNSGIDSGRKSELVNAVAGVLDDVSKKIESGVSFDVVSRAAEDGIKGAGDGSASFDDAVAALKSAQNEIK
ncbi:hypothetical protein DesfrDRAFT_3707 [Solidesulfovibrio fructosivorans JJ]]|uniref:Uncharacterized protein n=1 Tax=Solidesulfovibrio fructosivorans JJ] TaxID=596151 RepID=E1K1F7_SOLFR|nr:hypothetical protein [Solidesulfovibrio fructosivorans]EFL49572.1 hypothetical protein DesfrDRAFT_3707 [Solidesulfovibrio fructosivorans JJ]]